MLSNNLINNLLTNRINNKIIITILNFNSNNMEAYKDFKKKLNIIKMEEGVLIIKMIILIAKANNNFWINKKE